MDHLGLVEFMVAPGGRYPKMIKISDSASGKVGHPQLAVPLGSLPVNFMIKIIVNEGPGATAKPPQEIPLRAPKSRLGGPFGARLGETLDY
jgi:hypothetical protein